jgi:hypothetical protein
MKRRRKKKRWKGRALRLCVICARRLKTCSRLPMRSQTRLGRMTGFRKLRTEKTGLSLLPQRIAADVEISQRCGGDRPTSIIGSASAARCLVSAFRRASFLRRLHPPLSLKWADSIITTKLSPCAQSWQSMGAIVRFRAESRFIFKVIRHVIRYSIPSSRNR